MQSIQYGASPRCIYIYMVEGSKTDIFFLVNSPTRTGLGGVLLYDTRAGKVWVPVAIRSYTERQQPSVTIYTYIYIYIYIYIHYNIFELPCGLLGLTGLPRMSTCFFTNLSFELYTAVSD